MVEVEEIGVRCSFSECNQLQFIPFKCERCNFKFCIEHVKEGNHKCISKIDNNNNIQSTNSQNNSGKLDSIVCMIEGCSNLGVRCKKCQQLLCSRHIYPLEHNCKNISENNNKNKLKKQINTKKYSRDVSLKGVKLPEANKTNEILRKVIIRSKSTGDKNIPVESRLAIALYVDKEIDCYKLDNKELPVCIWINGEKSIGWNIDYIAEKLGIIKKDSQETNKKKLALHQKGDIHEGNEFKMAINAKCCIKDGDTLQMRYINEN